MTTSLEELISSLRPRLGDYLSLMGYDASKKFSCIAPDHSDGDPSMNVHQGVYAKCFGCGKTADIFTAAHWLENKPIDGPEFVTENIFYLATKLAIPYSIIKNDNAKSALKYSYLRAYKVVADYIQAVADSKEAPESFDKELRRRKWKKKESIELGLGCVSNFRDVLNLLLANSFTKDFVEIAGLMRPDIFNPDGLIFTVYDEYSRPIAFYMRDTRYEEKRALYDAASDKLEISKPKCPVKYNSTANYVGVYEKSLMPYGLHDIRNCHKIIAVEGHGCKHNLKLNNIDNVIALGGLELNEQTIGKLTSLGVTNMSLLLDNDIRGKEKVKNIIRKYYGKTSVEFSVIDMSAFNDVKDPDEFIRKHGGELFRELPEKNGLEWLTRIELLEKGDPYTVLQEITPLIALERSPISRLKIINLIAELTGIERDIIQEEVDQKISNSKDRKSEYALKVIDEVKELLIMNPLGFDAAINLMESKLGALNKDSENEDLFSSNEFLKGLVKLQDSEESEELPPVIHTGYTDWDKHCPLPPNEAFVLVLGPPNTGKSSLFINMAIRVLEYNPNAMVIIHTIDDSRDVYLNRLVAALARIKINWIKRPGYYLNEELSGKRQQAYKQLSDWILNERLIIKDVVHGNTVEYHGRLVQFYRDKYPNRYILAQCDNLHRLDTESHFDDGRFKTKAISSLMKSYTTKYNLVEMCTVEMTKQGMYEKPTNAQSIAEAASLQFDANLIIYLWNEQNVLREEAMLTFESFISEFHPEMGYVHKPTTKPIIEALFLKNKLSEFKGSIYFNFHPELAIYDETTIESVREIVAAAKKARDDAEKEQKQRNAEWKESQKAKEKK